MRTVNYIPYDPLHPARTTTMEHLWSELRAWLDERAPDVVCLQETKLSDADAPFMTFQMAGYQLVHHGEGRWNGVAVTDDSVRSPATWRSTLRRFSAPGFFAARRSTMSCAVKFGP